MNKSVSSLSIYDRIRSTEERITLPGTDGANTAYNSYFGVTWNQITVIAQQSKSIHRDWHLHRRRYVRHPLNRRCISMDTTLDENVHRRNEFVRVIALVARNQCIFDRDPRRQFDSSRRVYKWSTEGHRNGSPRRVELSFCELRWFSKLNLGSVTSRRWNGSERQTRPIEHSTSAILCLKLESFGKSSGFTVRRTRLIWRSLSK